jgi:hypothetical protein
VIQFKSNRDIQWEWAFLVQPSGYISDVCSTALVHSNCAAYISGVIKISRSVLIVVTQNGKTTRVIMSVAIYNGRRIDNITY